MLLLKLSYCITQSLLSLLKVVTLHLAHGRENLHASWDPLLIVQTQQCLGLVSADALLVAGHGAAANQQQLHRHHSTLLTFWGCSANTSLDSKKEKMQ